MDPRVKRLIIGVVSAFSVLVLLGYLVPLKWTGFQGNTLWDWFGLLMLPFVISTIRLWSDLRPRLDTRHFVIAGIELAIFAAVVVAGYVIPWKWTGFTGNTLWDWIQLLAVPILLPTVVMPAAREFINMGVEERRDAAEGDDGEEEGPDDLGYAGPRETAAERRRPIHTGRTALAFFTIAAVLVGGVAGAIAFGNDGISSNQQETTTTTTTASSTPGAATTGGGACTKGGTTTLSATEDGSVVRDGQTYVACLTGGRPITLGTGRSGVALAHFAVTPERVAFTEKTCDAAKTACTTKLMLARSRDGRVFNPQTFDSDVKALALTPGGGVAVMLAKPAKLVLIDNGQTRDAAEGDGLDPDSLAQSGSTVYWRMNGRPASAQLG